MTPLHFFLPLGGKPKWDNNELRYCLRSLEANCKYPFKVTIYATEPVEWLQNVDIKIVPRFYPSLRSNLNDNRDYENYYDTLNKMRIFVNTDVENDTFIYIYDDVILLKELEYDDYFKVFALHKESETYYGYRKSRNSKHDRTVNKAMDMVKGLEYYNGWNLYNFETHLPRPYASYSLLTMFDLLDEFTFPPYSIASLYYNAYDFIFLPLVTDKPILLSDQSIKAEFFGDWPDDIISCSSDTFQDIEKGVKDKWWLNYNDKGLTDNLKNWIMQKFPNKSRFEK